MPPPKFLYFYFLFIILMMSRKTGIVFFSLLVTILIPPLNCMAASGEIIKTQQVDMWLLAKSNIGAITLQSCDNQPLESVFAGTIRPNQTKDFCLAFINSSSKDVTLEYGFTDYGFNKDNTIICDETINTGIFFSYVLGYWTSTVVVPASWYAVKFISFKAPKTWALTWCISYRSLDDSLFAGMFNIVYRKTFPINFSLSGHYYWVFAQWLDRCKGLKNNKGFWIWTIIVLWWLFVYVLAKKPRDKKHKHTK